MSKPLNSPPRPSRLTGHRALRRGRVSICGGVYFVTATTVGRARLFEAFESAAAAARVFESRDTLRTSNMLGWVLMPDHAHWLLQIGEGDRLDNLVKRLKGRSALHCNRAMNREGAVWAPGYMDQGIREEAAIIDFGRYIVANPLRAGLVESVSDYSFWNAVWV